MEGVLPAAFDGAYVRNGPNPYLQPVGGLHWSVARNPEVKASDGPAALMPAADCQLVI